VPVVAARLDERGGSGRLPADLGPEPGSEPGSEHRRLRLTAQLAGAAPDETDATPRRWSLVLADADGGEHAVGWPPEAPQWLGAGGGDVVLSRSETGDVDVVDAVGTLVVDELTHAPDEIVLRGRWLGRAPRHLALRLEGRRTRLDADVDEVGGVLQARLPTHHDEWGLGATAVGPGRYWLRLLHGATPEQQVPGRVLVGEELLDRLVAPTVDAVHRFRPARRGREAGLVLQPPVADEDLAPRGQARLQEWYRRCELPVDPDLVYLQSYAGASATDSPLAIHEVLRRRHPHLRICWGVADLSSAVPEGGVPVVMHSPEWYRVLATAAHLCLNVEPDRWFEPRPGQQLMFTSHGYPGKSMGIREWVSKGHSPRRIEQELARTSGRWSLLLTPAPEMDEHYRREYRYDGPIHHDGYPRDDLLLSPDAGRVRDETRARLGIAPEQTVVLYAPTWRDDAATHWRRAELVTHLDLDAASRELGPDHVFLMRGHRFHSAADHAGGSQVLDVTAYPEVNHLVLAADVAVLDYSSLRFDFALTGRPMVFLVPDLAAYAGTVRGFLYPFEDSAPGPLLDTGEQVVEQLRDLDGLRQRYGAAIEEFNRRYNHRQTGGSAESVVAAFFG
jgi:CDP-glycerol glycerophosphotransferase